MRNLLAQGRIGWQEWFWMICLYHMGMHKKTAPYDTNVNTSYNDGGAQSYGADSDYKVKVLIHFSQELDPKNRNFEKGVKIIHRPRRGHLRVQHTAWN